MDIDDEEFVETSDIEELADLQNVRRFTAKSPRRAAGHEADEDIPRKRIKVGDLQRLLHKSGFQYLFSLNIFRRNS